MEGGQYPEDASGKNWVRTATALALLPKKILNPERNCFLTTFTENIHARICQNEAYETLQVSSSSEFWKAVNGVQ